MGAKATIWAWRNAADLPSATVLVAFLAIADIANDRTGKLWASHAYIADKAHLSPRSVRGSVQVLEAKGLIRTEPKQGACDVIWLNLTPVMIYDLGAEPDEEVTASTARSRPKPRQVVPGAAAPGAPTPAPPADKPKEEPKKVDPKEEAPPKPATPAGARGTRIPFGWTADEKDRAFAIAEGFDPSYVRRLEDEFYDYWKSVAGAKGVKSDWSATWRNSVRMKAERLGGSRGTGIDGGQSTAAGRRHAERIEPMQSGIMAALNRRAGARRGGAPDPDQPDPEEAT